MALIVLLDFTATATAQFNLLQVFVLHALPCR
jgi:hypothetical protein